MIGRIFGFAIALMLVAIMASQSANNAADSRSQESAFYSREHIQEDVRLSLESTREARKAIHAYRQNLGMFPALNRLAKLPEPDEFADGPLASFEVNDAKATIRLTRYPDVVVSLAAHYEPNKKYLRWDCEVSNLPEARMYKGTTEQCYAYDSDSYADRMH